MTQTGYAPAGDVQTPRGVRSRVAKPLNGIRFTELERQRLKRLRYEGHEPATAEEVNAA
jgi:hypothetical protein